MNTFVQKSKDDQNNASAARYSSDRSSAQASRQFSGNSTVIAQKALEDELNDSPKVQAELQLKQSLNQSPETQSLTRMQQMLNQSPRVVAQAKLAEALSGRKGTLQARPTISPLELPEEEEPLSAQMEADPLQREATAEDEEEPVQAKPDPIQREEMAEEEEPVQARFEPAQKQENKTGLPDQLKAGIESISGRSMDDVKVHYNSSKPAQLQALAYTQGEDIHVGPGQERHLPHEAWHVVQQKQGRVRPTLQAKNVAINNDQRLEMEADMMGAQAASEHLAEELPGQFAGTSGEAPPSGVQSGGNESNLQRAASGSIGESVIQPKFGFELEMQVVLSKGPRAFDKEAEKEEIKEEAESSKTLRILNRTKLKLDDLQSGQLVPSQSIPDYKHVWVRDVEQTYVWEKFSRAVPDGVTIIMPPDLMESSEEIQTPLEEIKPSLEELKPPLVESATQLPLSSPSSEEQEELPAGRWVLTDKVGTRAKDKSEYPFFDPMLTKSEPVYKDENITVVEDHMSGLGELVSAGGRRGQYSSIVEIVTDARDEYDPDQQRVIAPMKDAVELAEDIDKETHHLTERVAAGLVLRGAATNIYIGLPLLPGETPFQTTDASVQTTFAVQLARVPQMMMEKMKRRPGGKGIFSGNVILNEEEAVLSEAIQAANQVAGELDQEFQIGPNLYGLLHLLSMYLRGGSRDHFAQLDKNRVPLLLRDQITAIASVGLTRKEKDLLSDEKFQKAVIKSLLANTDRGSGENLFMQDKGGPTTSNWLMAILSGESDPQLPRWEEMRKISPEPVGPQPKPGAESDVRPIAPVMEERHTTYDKYSLGTKIPSSEWIPMAMAQQERLLKFNEPVEGATEGSLTATTGTGGKVSAQSSIINNNNASPSISLEDFSEVEESPKQEELKYGPGLPIGTMVEAMGKTGQIIADVPGSKRYTVRWTMGNRTIEGPLAYSAPATVLPN